MMHVLSNLNVYYGWSRINKIRKKRAISVIYENCQGARLRGAWLLKRLQDTYYTRKQTIGEAEDGKHSNRIFTEYSLLLDEKPFNSDLDKCLQCNYDADCNNVPSEELEKIKAELKKGFKITYETENRIAKTSNSPKC
ncbi:MAG: hypothetical protein VB075_19465 [Petrimonas sp.]|uniref:hypothetical protein n=1 Tax=Petrimonas sp. TaxID=2023866 RepID=UPI002B3C10EF|nr:hypothetical protein [Petrimonas sp.]